MATAMAAAAAEAAPRQAPPPASPRAWETVVAAREGIKLRGCQRTRTLKDQEGNAFKSQPVPAEPGTDIFR